MPKIVAMGNVAVRDNKRNRPVLERGIAVLKDAVWIRQVFRFERGDIEGKQRLSSHIVWCLLHHTNKLQNCGTLVISLHDPYRSWV